MQTTTCTGVDMSVRMTQVTALVLHAVGTGHRYGFDIMDATGIASGSVYPVLRRLEEARLLRGTWEEAPAAQRGGRPQRRYYEVTEAGERALADAGKKLASARSFLMQTAPAEEG
jgi:DNA-binding PadR family transcriptional regulator